MCSIDCVILETATVRSLPMRIAHITHSFPPYEAGTGRVCYYNAVELARLGHEVTVYTAAYPTGDFVYPLEIRVRHLPTLLRFGNAPLMPGIVSEVRDVDVIHLHFPFIFGAELTWLTAAIRNIPYVITHHNDLVTVGNRNRQFLFDCYYPITKFVTVRRASKYAVVSLQHAENCGLTEIYKRRWEDVVEIPNGVDTSVFYSSEREGAEVRQLWEIPLNAPLVTFVGALDKAHMFKGVDRLISAFSKLQSTDAYLMIVGDGEMRDSYQQLAREAGLGARVIFPGKVSHDQLRAYYSAADVVVLPSDPPESFGMVLIEANACGRPVIASDIPGVSSVVDDGVTGLLFKQGDTNDLLAKLETLLRDSDLRQQFGQAGKEKVSRSYSWSAIAQKLETLYENLIEDRRALAHH
jgi:glycosyltransferase involved in cell wall biosynthesis